MGLRSGLDGTEKSYVPAGIRIPNRPARSLDIVKFVLERKMFGEKAFGENWNTHLCEISLSWRDKTNKHE